MQSPRCSLAIGQNKEKTRRRALSLARSPWGFKQEWQNVNCPVKEDTGAKNCQPRPSGIMPPEGVDTELLRKSMRAVAIVMMGHSDSPHPELARLPSPRGRRARAVHS
jgi:hypothetical protein